MLVEEAMRRHVQNLVQHLLQRLAESLGIAAVRDGGQGALCPEENAGIAGVVDEVDDSPEQPRGQVLPLAHQERAHGVPRLRGAEVLWRRLDYVRIELGNVVAENSQDLHAPRVSLRLCDDPLGNLPLLTRRHGGCHFEKATNSVLQKRFPGILEDPRVVFVCWTRTRRAGPGGPRPAEESPEPPHPIPAASGSQVIEARLESCTIGNRTPRVAPASWMDRDAIQCSSG